jgi:dTDP-4-dehydrorhamnose reductase
MKKILVLGSNGQLGRCLQDQLAKTKYVIIYASREEIDIADSEATKTKLLKYAPDVVINAAAYTAVDKAEENEQKANMINHLAVSNLASICNQLSCWLVHISTDYVFDGKSKTAYEEEDKTNPISIYGSSKLLGEIAIKSSGCNYIIIRTAWVYSEYGNNFLKTMLRFCKDKSEISIVGDQIGSPTYAQDIAKAILTILKNIKLKKVSSSLYHFSGNFTLSWADFSELIFDEALALKIINNKPKINIVTTNEFSTLAERPARSHLSSRKLRSTFDIHPSNLILGIRSTLNAIKNSEN